MLQYILKRILLFIPTLFIVYTIAFFLMRVLPGDPAIYIVGKSEDQAAIENLRRLMKLDEPIFNQYIAFLQNSAQGSLGNSYVTKQPVTEMIGEAFPFTFTLAIAAIIVAIAIGIPLGILAALRKNSFWDNLSRVLALIGVSIPIFWLGIQMQLLFSLNLRWFPVSGPGLDNHLIMPAVALSAGTVALLARMTRSTMLEQLNQDYIRTAYSKGLATDVVVLRHALRNALLPIMTVLGTNFGNLLTGALIVEIIFRWPGLGFYLFQAISTRDYSLLQGLLIVLVLIYSGVNLLIDLSYAVIDPRIRYS